MRILFITLKTVDLVNLNVIYYLEKEVSKIVDCNWAGKGWPNYVPNEPLNKTIKRLYGNDPPDWVVSNRPDLLEYKKIVLNTEGREYGLAMTLTDLHINPKEWIKVANAGFDVSFLRYLYSPKIKKLCWLKPLSYYADFDPYFYIRNLKTRFFCLPWFIDPTIYKPKEGEKKWDVAFMGSYSRKVYPLRYEIVKELPKVCKEKKWKYLLCGRPPGKTIERHIQKLINHGYYVGTRYAEALASCKILIFGSSIFKYPVSKYFEAMACKTLVMADTPQMAEILHFKPDWNFVEINPKNWKEKLDYYLTNEEEREKIANRGYETVMRYHTSKIRAKQLVSYLKAAE